MRAEKRERENHTCLQRLPPFRKLWPDCAGGSPRDTDDDGDGEVGIPGGREAITNERASEPAGLVQRAEPPPLPQFCAKMFFARGVRVSAAAAVVIVEEERRSALAAAVAGGGDNLQAALPSQK